MRLFKKGLTDPVMKKFIFFILILGLNMPSFMTFDYYFHLDIQKVPLEMINL